MINEYLSFFGQQDVWYEAENIVSPVFCLIRIDESLLSTRGKENGELDKEKQERKAGRIIWNGRRGLGTHVALSDSEQELTGVD